MDDIQSFHTRSYDKSEDLEEVTPLQRAITIIKVLPILIFKSLILGFVFIFYSLKAVFHLFVPKTMSDIRGQLAAVTGGSNGIGRGICMELARCGCNVACLDVDLEAGEKLCIELRELGVKANAYKVDVSDPKCIEEVKKQINCDMGTVDILVNNAGLMPKDSFRRSSPDDIRRVMDVNVLSHFWTTRVFIGDMIARRRGFIVAISSMIALYPMSVSVAYTTSKYAVKGFMDALNRDSQHENWGVKTLTVFPHLTNTRKEITEHLRRIIKPSTMERVKMRSPNEVGKEAVNALRRGEVYVTMPRYYILLAHLYLFLPFAVQNFADRLFMPRITSDTNYSAALDNGRKKLH